MGADRKGPLAAFVVIAIIAAVLLVTSVRSQALPGAVTTADPASTPGLGPQAWTSVTDDLAQTVEQGFLLVRKATSDPVRTADPTSTSLAVTTDVPGSGGDSADPVTQPAAPATRTVSRHLARRATHAGRHDSGTHRVRATAPSASTATPTAPTGHGRHLGWAEHGHGNGHGNGHGDHGRHLGRARHGS